MISKFAVHGRDRREAIERMRRGLAEYEIDGIKTTLPFFREIFEDEEFVAGRLDTGFIERFNERRTTVEPSEEAADIAAIAAALVYAEKTRPGAARAVSRKRSRWVTAFRDR
jgi:acetyl/propionyl-CoA carboxylase alpha subunit